jgi:hypothetical protein
MMLTLRPSRIRHIWARGLELVIPYFLGVFTKVVIDFVRSAQLPPLEEMLEDAFPHLGIGLLAILLVSFFDVKKYSIVLTEGMIEGPSKKNPEKRICFPISHLDRTQGEDRNVFQMILGQRILHSVNDERILLNETVFSSDQLQTLFQRLNYTV